MVRFQCNNGVKIRNGAVEKAARGVACLGIGFCNLAFLQIPSQEDENSSVSSQGFGATESSQGNSAVVGSVNIVIWWTSDKGIKQPLRGDFSQPAVIILVAPSGLPPCHGSTKELY